MSGDPNQLLEIIRASGRVTAADVSAIRQMVYPDGRIGADEATFLMRVEAAAGEFDPEWSALFREAFIDFCVHQSEPHGYVSPENADWLIQCISADAHTRTATELEMLIGIVETARWVPEKLSNFLIEELKSCVLAGTTPLANGAKSHPGVVDPGEVDLIRRALTAAGGEGHVAITQAEAEILFDINDATVGANNAPEWDELFVRSILNHVLGYSGYKAPDRAEALRLERWAQSPSDGGFMGRMLSGGLSAIFDAYSQPSADEAAIARLEAQHRRILLDEQVTDVEADWVAKRINRDGEISGNEKALIRLLSEHGADISPWLGALRKASA